MTDKKKGIGARIRDLVYPPHLRCAVCGDELSVTSRYDLCDRCTLTRIESYCRFCGKSVPPQNTLCEDCASAPGAFTAARSAFVYADAAAQLVRRLKYYDAQYLARTMAEYMYDVFLETDWHVDLVTSVPIHRSRRLARGYNQSELLANEIAERIARPVAVCLRKTVRTANMARLNRAERFAQIADTFALVEGAEVTGKDILLIDDVLTTGATSGECARVLRGAGARAVYVLTFASGNPRKPQLI